MSISRRHATGKARQRANQNKPKGKYLIQKGGKLLKKRENVERNEVNNMLISMHDLCLVLVLNTEYYAVQLVSNLGVPSVD